MCSNPIGYLESYALALALWDEGNPMGATPTTRVYVCLWGGRAGGGGEGVLMANFKRKYKEG